MVPEMVAEATVITTTSAKKVRFILTYIQYIPIFVPLPEYALKAERCWRGY
jgi:hypothetical protein